MRITVSFLLLAGLICKCSSQNLQPGAGSPVVGQNPNLPPPPPRAGARNNITSAQNPTSAGSPNHLPAAGSVTGNPRGPTAGGPTGNRQPPTPGAAGNPQPPQPGTSTGNQQSNNAGQSQGDGNSTNLHQATPNGNQQPPAGPGVATGNRQPPVPGAGAGNQQPPTPGAGASAGHQQPKASTTTTQVPTTTPTTQAPTTTTTTTQTPTTPKSTIVTTCPATWKKYNGACYQMFTGSDTKNFRNAENYCRGQKGNLVSVNDKKEYTYLMKEFMYKLPNTGGITSVWIGLYCKKGKDFFWTDGSDTDGKALYRPDLMYFKSRGKLISTITLSKMGNMNGYFGVPMTKSLPFICEITLGGKKMSKKEYACGYGWKMFKGRCYRMFSEYERFFAAERQCNQYHGHLVSLNSKKEHKFVRGLFKTKHPAFGPWVGMIDIKHNNLPTSFKWTDGSLTDYTPPTMFNNLPAPNPNYGMMCKNSSILDVTPYYQLPFICEREIPKGCDLGWDRFQDYCYVVIKTPTTVVEGRKLCWKAKATLASVCSFDEYKHMMRMRQLFGFKSAWTGAYFLKPNKKDILVWSDRRGCTYNPPGKYGSGFDKFAVLSDGGLKREAGTKKFPVICKKMAKNECIFGFKKMYQHDDPLLLVTSATDIKECKKACLEKDGCEGCTFAEYQGNRMCYLHHIDGGQLPMMTSVDLQHWKRCTIV